MSTSIGKAFVGLRNLNPIFSTSLPPVVDGTEIGGQRYYQTDGTSQTGNIIKSFEFDNVTNTWVPIDGGSAVATPTLSSVISIGTQAQLNAIVTKELNGLYILNDTVGVNKGDILRWVDTNGDDVGDAFVLAQAMTVDGVQRTVLTNDSGVNAGVYEYDLTTDMWTLFSAIVPLVSETGAAVGGVRLPQRSMNWKTDNAPMFVLGYDVAGVGKSPSYLTDNGSITAPTAVSVDTQGGDVRVSPYSYLHADTPYVTVKDYDPKFFDVAGNSQGGIAQDYLGHVYWKGTAAYMGNMTGADSKSSSVIVSGLVPDAFIAGLPSKVLKFNHSFNTNHVIVVTADGKVYFKGITGTTGVYGDNTTTTNDLWHKWIVPQQEYIKCMVSPDGGYAGVLSAGGDLYMCGVNTFNRFIAGSSGLVVSTPALVQANVKDFALIGQSTSTVKFDGSRSFIGNNLLGQAGDNTIANKTVWTNITSAILYKKVLDTAVDSLGWLSVYTYISSDDKAYYSGFNNGATGDGTGTGNKLVPTLMGTGAYQGTVIDIRCYTKSSLIWTNQGTVWTSADASGAGGGELGWGVNTVAGVGIGLAVFKKVPIRGLVKAVHSSCNSTNSAQYTVLAEVDNGTGTATGEVSSWGVAELMDNGAEIRFGPNKLGIGRYNPITPAALGIVYNIIGTVSALSAGGTASIALDNAPMLVTFSVPAVGTIGGYISPITVTTAYPYATVSAVGQGYYNILTGMVTFTATVTSTDNPTLVAPNTAPITYNVTYGASTVAVTGVVQTDPVYGAVTGANLAAYTAAPIGQMVGFEFTAAELATAKTLMTTWGALGMNTSDPVNTGTNLLTTFGSSTVANSSVATQIPAGKTIYIVGACSNLSYVAGTSTFKFKIYNAALTSGVDLGVIPATTPIYSSATGVAPGVHFFAIKGGFLTTGVSQLAVTTQSGVLGRQTSGSGAPKWAVGDVTAALTFAGTATDVISLQAIGL